MRTSQPRPHLLKVAAQATMRPELRRFSLLHQAAASVSGYPDWTTTVGLVRLLNQREHCSISVTTRDIRFIHEAPESLRGSLRDVIPQLLFDHLAVSELQRMGHRRWYFLPLEMTFPEAAKLFFERYYSEADPVRAAGHRVEDLLYRIDSTDSEGYHWRVSFAPITNAQIASAVEYDLEGHWPAAEARAAGEKLLRRLPEVGLYQDLDCSRDIPDSPISDWGPFLEESGRKLEELSQTLFASFFRKDLP